MPLIVQFGGRAKNVKPQKMLHGGKGASLIEMTALGLRVPPGFILTTEAYRKHEEDSQSFRSVMDAEVKRAIAHIERAGGRRFGDDADPLLVSVRSGAPVSMPGMMDTILNLGLNLENAQAVAKRSGDRFAWSSLLRLISQFTNLLLLPGKEDKDMNALLDMGRPPKDGSDAKSRCLEALDLLHRKGKEFPQDPEEQLWAAITLVFRSWDNDRAKVYRKLQNIPETLGTACTVQAMVFGNRSQRSGTGVCFSRNPSTGDPGLNGEYLPMGQGEDVVAGLRTPLPLRTSPTGGNSDSLESLQPKVFRELDHHVQNLEQCFRDVVDVEFTVEEGILYFLQCRSAKRSAEAAVRIACDLEREGLLTSDQALLRITPDHIKSLLRPHFDPAALERTRVEGTLLTKGLPAGPGAASGRIAFCEEHAPEGEPWILVRRETSPEDVAAMSRAAGVMTIHGGMSSHAALVARQLGVVCVVGCEEARLDLENGTLWFGEQPMREGEWISLDGSTGAVYSGTIPTSSASLDLSGLLPLLSSADRHRRLGIYANADTPDQARIARDFGAEGIGLCRTEHMFFGSDRLLLIRGLILADSDLERMEALEQLEKLQRDDLRGILLAMDGLPVIVRTIDPPLHEFLPKGESEIASLAQTLRKSPDDVRQRVESMHEANPMLGFRGCRLGIVYPEIPLMQVRALANAACDLTLAGKEPKPGIMIPLTSTAEELKEHRTALETEAKRMMRERGCSLDLPIGTMIEVPRAALVAGQLAEFADFFSFGTNDLTQLTYGISRDDASTFLPAYVERGIYPSDPFASLDAEGVGQLMEIALLQARRVKPKMSIGICGEHGGDPASIEFAHRLGLTYVSCSPYRIPIARLAAAHAALRHPRGQPSAPRARRLPLHAPRAPTSLPRSRRAGQGANLPQSSRGGSDRQRGRRDPRRGLAQGIR